MPTGVRSQTPLSVVGWTSATSGPLPFEPLLRSNGSGVPLDPDTARRVLAADAAAVLDAAGEGQGPSAWSRPSFHRRVERTRRQLAPIESASLLVESFRYEALHARPLARVPGAVRVAYAIRWLEVGHRVDAPSWRTLVTAPFPA